jgi:hypothetical protein
MHQARRDAARRPVRTIAPVYAPTDGDTLFTQATGSHGCGASLVLVGTMAAEVTAGRSCTRRGTPLRYVPPRRARTRRGAADRACNSAAVTLCTTDHA